MATVNNNLFEIIGAHQQELTTRFHIESLSVFGSVARGTSTSDSDVDILVKYREIPGFFGFLDLKKFLEDLTGRRVDLVTEGALKKQLKDQIVKESIRVA